MRTRWLDSEDERAIDDEALLDDLRRSFATFDPVPARVGSAAQVAFLLHRRRWSRGPSVAPRQTGPGRERWLVS
ncbi:MAG: hypothetical protein WKF33_07065 [Thermoleophilaceae bacterium]